AGGGARREGAARDARLGAQAGGQAEVCSVGLAPQLSLEQHLPRRGGFARGREAAQEEDPARRARGRPRALGRARAAGADRRVPSRRPPGPRGPRADLVSGPGELEAPRARLDEAPEVRRDGAALPPQRGMTPLPGRNGEDSVVDRHETELLESVETILHGLDRFRRVALPVHDLARDAQRLARAERLGGIPAEFLAGEVGIVLDRARRLDGIEPAASLAAPELPTPRRG